MNTKIVHLKKCPCGKIPDSLGTCDTGQGGKYANVHGTCCGDWETEFRTEYLDSESDEYQDLAIAAWNKALRGFDE